MPGYAHRWLTCLIPHIEDLPADQAQLAGGLAPGWAGTPADLLHALPGLAAAS